MKHTCVHLSHARDCPPRFEAEIQLDLNGVSCLILNSIVVIWPGELGGFTIGDDAHFVQSLRSWKSLIDRKCSSLRYFSHPVGLLRSRFGTTAPDKKMLKTSEMKRDSKVGYPGKSRFRCFAHFLRANHRRILIITNIAFQLDKKFVLMIIVWRFLFGLYIQISWRFLFESYVQMSIRWTRVIIFVWNRTRSVVREHFLSTICRPNELVCFTAEVFRVRSIWIPTLLVTYSLQSWSEYIEVSKSESESNFFKVLRCHDHVPHNRIHTCLSRYH